ncbi:MAG: hypothetical protein GXP44_00270 [bacterium]|nr:hypothetical protein [bacterium]
MRKDKHKAFQLRKNGKSYKEINRLLKISLGTLSEWFKKEEWSRIIKEQKIAETKRVNSKRLRKINLTRKRKLEVLYKEMRMEAQREFVLFKKSFLFATAIALYWGEGDNSRSTGIVRISNTDFAVIKIFSDFLVKFCDVDKKKIRIWLLLYPNLDEQECKQKWIKKTKIPAENFYKTQVIKGKHKTKRLPYGVGNIIISNKCLKEKILEWIKLSRLELK